MLNRTRRRHQICSEGSPEGFDPALYASGITSDAWSRTIAPSYMTRVLRLTLLAPDIVEAVLGGKQASEVTLARLMGGFPVEWDTQATRVFRRPS